MQNKSTNLMISNIKLHKSLRQSSVDLYYKFLEKRNYIQGVVALDGMFRCCSMLLPELKNKTYEILEAKIFSEINFGTTAVAYFQNKNLKVRKLVKIIQASMNSKSKILVKRNYKKFKKVKIFESKHLNINSKKVKKYLNWSPKLSIKEAVSLTVNWYNAYKENKSLIKISQNQILEYLKKIS